MLYGAKCQQWHYIFIDIKNIKTFTKQSKCSERKLLNCCKEYVLSFIDNSNVSVQHLAQGGLHLNEEYKTFLVNNFVTSLNRYILWNKEVCSSLRDATQVNCTENKENFSSKNI